MSRTGFLQGILNMQFEEAYNDERHITTPSAALPTGWPGNPLVDHDVRNNDRS